MQHYIDDTIHRQAKIGYDRSVKQWVGMLHHPSGSIYSQQKTKTEVVKEMSEVLDEFLVRFFQQKPSGQSSIIHHAKTYPAQVSGAYQQA